MKSLRYVFSIAALSALAAGYLASQYFAFNGEAPWWARTADSPAVAWLALLVLLGAIALSLVKERA